MTVASAAQAYWNSQYSLYSTGYYYYQMQSYMCGCGGMGSAPESSGDEPVILPAPKNPLQEKYDAAKKLVPITKAAFDEAMKKHLELFPQSE